MNSRWSTCAAYGDTVIRTHSEVYTFARYAGQVTRYHTWPVHRQQSVGEHTWQMLRIYETIWGAIPSHITCAILWHDAGELFTGDVPYPAKAAHPSLKAAVDSAEAQALANMRRAPPSPELTLQEHAQVKMCDLIDMYEFGLVELTMGNDYAEPIVRVTAEAIDELGSLMPGYETDAVAAYVSRVQMRFKCTLSRLEMSTTPSRPA
jgi:5'-deoxynucleotidase YfbR-like HD superfamily hydrolase